jgi:enamine deaminase RidA (YjgF/YER057c/UK114 family)
LKPLKPKGIYHAPRYYPGLRAGNIITVAGRIPVNPDGSVFAPNDPAAQTAHIMEEIKLILAEGGATLNDVVSVLTLYLDEADSRTISDVRQSYFGDHLPPHTGIKNLSQSWVERGIRLEIEVMAVLENES